MAEPFAHWPGLTAAIDAVAADPAVWREVRAVLDSPKVRGLIWQVVENQFSDNRFGLIRRAVVLFVQHRGVRPPVGPRRHGVLRELRRKQ